MPTGPFTKNASPRHTDTPSQRRRRRARSAPVARGSASAEVAAPASAAVRAPALVASTPRSPTCIRYQRRSAPTVKAARVKSVMPVFPTTAKSGMVSRIRPARRPAPGPNVRRAKSTTATRIASAATTEGIRAAAAFVTEDPERRRLEPVEEGGLVEPLDAVEVGTTRSPRSSIARERRHSAPRPDRGAGPTPAPRRAARSPPRRGGSRGATRAEREPRVRERAQLWVQARAQARARGRAPGQGQARRTEGSAALRWSWASSRNRAHSSSAPAAVPMPRERRSRHLPAGATAFAEAVAFRGAQGPRLAGRLPRERLRRRPNAASGNLQYAPCTTTRRSGGCSRCTASG